MIVIIWSMTQNRSSAPIAGMADSITPAHSMEDPVRFGRIPVVAREPCSSSPAGSTETRAMEGVA
jgi:hypothetical protein